MRQSLVIDPGHGGTTIAGKSTPFGVRGMNGLVEKNVTLAVAQRVARRMGSGVRLTRAGDVNASLSERARLSRELGAPAFLSLHANGATAGRGAETWVHAQAGPESLELAEELGDELGRLNIPTRRAERGDLALLTPSLHRPGCAACLVELDHLDDYEGARRLGDPRELDALGDGIARALERFLGRDQAGTRRQYSFGRAWSRGQDAELDLTDFPTNVFVIVPDGSVPTVPRQITQSDHAALERAWDCMMRDRGLRVRGTDDHKHDFRVLLRGGLSDSPLIRGLFREIACDGANPITWHVGRGIPRILIDGFRFDASTGRDRQNGHHTIDMNDFDACPRVATTAHLNVVLVQQNLVHALREARQGVLGDAFPAAHARATADENDYRHEQGQIGAMPLRPTPLTGEDIRWDLTPPGGTPIFEDWHITNNEITSIDHTG